MADPPQREHLCRQLAGAATPKQVLDDLDRSGISEPRLSRGVSIQDLGLRTTTPGPSVRPSYLSSHHANGCAAL